MNDLQVAAEEEKEKRKKERKKKEEEKSEDQPFQNDCSHHAFVPFLTIK